MFLVNKKYLTAGCIGLMLFINTSAQNINTPNKSGPLGTKVNTLSGNLFLTRNDVYAASRGIGINCRFYYNSFNFDQNIGFGKGWSSMYSAAYKNDTALGKTIIWGDGREDAYRYNGAVYLPQNGIYSVLTQYQPNKFLVKELDGMKYYFDNSVHKKITRMEEPNGNFLSFSYTDSLLTTITNTAGQSITLAYNSGGNLISITDAITSPTRIYSYAYDNVNNLKEVTDPLGGKMKYTYLVNGPIKTMADKNGNIVDIIYFGDYTVREVIGCNKRQSFSYDTTLKITTVTDYLQSGSNQITKYRYQNFENISWITAMESNCCGYNMTFEYDQQGNKTKQTDANGHISTYTYDSRGNMLTMKDALNQTTTYTYSTDFNRVTSYTDAKGFTTNIVYDVKGNPTQITEPGNLVYSAAYAPNGDIVSSVDPKGNIFTYNYDALGNPTTAMSPNGYNATLAYDARGNLLSYTDARSNTSNMEYDILDRMKKITDPINNNIQLTYDAEGNATIVKNQNSENSFLKYDASNRIVEFKDAVGNKTTIGYDAMDNVTAINNAVGSTSTFGYDTKNRLTSSKNALGNTTGLSYDSKGNLTAATLPNGEQYLYSYDNLDRLTSISDLNGIVAQLTYDKNNRVTNFTNGTGASTAAEYDSINRIKKIIDALGNSSLMAYDKNSNIVSVTDRNGFTKTYTYDSLNRVKTMIDNNGSVTTATYDRHGNVTALKDANNNITNYTYDNLNRVKRTTYPDGNYIEYSYSNKGNITSKRLTDGTSIIFTYDTLNRIVAKNLPDGQVYTYTYDAIGRIKTATNNAGTVTLNYDLLNRVVSENFAGRTVNYAYNTAGRTQTTVYPDSSIITKLFDTRNRLVSISKNGNVLVSYSYNNADQMISKTLANGVITNLQYDANNRLINYTTANGVIQNTNITYDNEMHKTALTRVNTPTKSEQFVYDNGHRLINYKKGITGSPLLQNTYTYDALGNRANANLNGTATTYSVNNLNQLLSSNGGAQNINYAYDVLGNLTYDGTFYKKYDAEGRLQKDSSSPTNVLSYLYDGFGRRVQKNFNGNLLKYTFSGLSQIEERDGAGIVKNKTIFNNYMMPLSNERNGANYYYHQNELNSVEAITNSSGSTVEKYEYDVYGKQTRFDSLGNLLTASITGNLFGFTGQQYDSATASNKFLFREYNPSTGTFNERDLIGYADGMGMYQYVHNNPANGVDVFGLEDCGGHETSTPKTWIDYTDNAQWYSGQFSNLGSFLQVFQSSTTKTMMITKSVQFFGQTGTYLVEVKQHGLLGNLSTFVNSTPLSYAMVPFNAANTVTPAFDMYFNGSEMSAGQIFDNSTSMVSGGATTGVGLYALSSEPAMLTATGLASVPAAFAAVALAGGLAIEGSLDYAYSKATGYVNGTGKGDHFTDVGANNDIPLFTSASRGFWNWLDGYDDVERQARFYQAMHNHNTSRWDEASNKKRTPTEHHGTVIGWQPRIINCPQNSDPGGTRTRRYFYFLPNGDSVEVVQSKDPNAILGPDGVAAKKWVSVNDVLPYTILYENDKTATAPAKYVKVIYPIDAKQDAATFSLGSFGFNNLTFSIPPNTAAYSQRLDARDSLGLFVDITAGYDVTNNKAFWEFQSIDPLTLLPPSNPNKGFLLLQDTPNPNNGHAFVNFSIKPKQTDITLDTIHAEAKIVFDGNDTIPTNYIRNTVDAFAPTSHMNTLPATSPNPVQLSWTGTDDAGGSGVKSYTLYVSTNGVSFYILKAGMQRLDTSIALAKDSSYCFFVLATDSVGNMETLRQNEIKCSLVSGAALPVSWLYFRGSNKGKDNLLEWATSNEQNSKEFVLERSLTGVNFIDIAKILSQGNSNTQQNYNYKDVGIDKLNSAVMYYRIKQIDINGNFKYSNIVRLNYNIKEKLNSIVYPNPTQGMITVTVGENSLIGTLAVVMDVNGRILQQTKIAAQSQSIDIKNFSNGTYFIRLQNKEVLRIIKQ